MNTSHDQRKNSTGIVSDMSSVYNTDICVAGTIAG